MNNNHWAAGDLTLLRELYPNTPTRDLAVIFDRSIRSIYEKALSIGLRKTKEYLASGKAGRLDGVRGMPTRFKPGMTPWNKDMKGLDIGGKETRFKKGDKPHTWRPIGTERTTDEGYLQRKMTDTGRTRRDYVNVHWLVWFEAGREIPPGHILVFKNEDRTDIRLDNLECISRQENMRRNSYHNLPKPVAELVQLRGALNRKINRLARKESDEQRDHC